MGCSSSLHAKNDKGEPAIISVPLSDLQKTLVRDTWVDIEKQKSKVGCLIFVSLFEKWPNLKNSFPEFKDIKSLEELRTARAFMGHAKRIMNALENSVTALDDAESFTSYLQELGRRHVTRALKPEYLTYMGEALQVTLKDLLKDRWNQDIADAWDELFKFLTSMMKRGLEAEKKGR